ncbi:hypothetical protein DAMA08_013800 [Martiniozyma asiatica (nom. inval.)]|nr:hypothetical protein DAMA08_013800 [Martiniozyma asiatica]
MSSLQITFETILDKSVERNYPPETFTKLVGQWRQRRDGNSYATCDLLKCLLNYDLRKGGTILRKYLVQFVIVCDYNKIGDRLKMSFEMLKECSLENQWLFLLSLNQGEVSGVFSWMTFVENVELVETIMAYVTHVAEKISENKESLPWKKISSETIELTCRLVEIENSNIIEVPETVIKLLEELNEKLQNLNLIDWVTPLARNLEIYKDISIQRKIRGTNENLFTSRPDTQNNAKTLKLKKFIWLAQKITIEFDHFDENTLIEFKKVLNISTVPTTESIELISTELISGAFLGFELALDKSKILWESFIVWRLPYILKNIININQIKLETCLNAIKPMQMSMWMNHPEILLKFNNSLIELKLLSISNTIFSNEKNDLMPVSISLDELKTEFTKKFIDSNPEFFSLDDSTLSKFTDLILPHVELRINLAEIVMDALNTFAITNDTPRLRRLLIFISTNESLTDCVMVGFLSPYKLIRPLLKIMENQVVQNFKGSNDNFVHDTQQSDLMMDLDLALEENSNVQSSFTDVSITLVFLQYIFQRYSLQLDSHNLPKNLPNIFSLLSMNGTLFKFNKTETDINVSEILINDETVDNWISSLFDSSNSEGISDSLIQASTPIEYSILFPKVINQALVCYHLGWLDDETVNGGFEYFHEGFLAGWLSNVINEICLMKWKSLPKVPDSIDKNVFNETLERIIKNLLFEYNTEDKELKIVTNLVRQVMAQKIWDNFPNLRNYISNFENTRVEVMPMVKRVLKLVNIPMNSSEAAKILKTTDEKYKFDLAQIYQQLSLVNLPIDWLYSLLKNLVSGIHHDVLPDLAYEMVASLVVNYSKWQTDSQLSTWLNNLITIKNFQENKLEDFLDVAKLVYNSAPHSKSKIWKTVDEGKETPGNGTPGTATIIGIKHFHDIVGNIQLQKPKDETDELFQFLDDPKDMMDIDAVKLEPSPEPERENLDIYGVNLYTLLVSNSDEKFGSKIMSCL